MRKYFYWSILALAFSIPLSAYISVKLLLAVLAFSLFQRTGASFSSFLYRFWQIVFYLAVLVIGVLYSEDKQTAMSVLETRFSLLAMPVIFWKASDFSQRELFDTIKAFTLGLFVACLICLMSATVAYAETGDLSNFLFEKLTTVIHAQPTYFAYYLIFAVAFLLFGAYYDSGKAPRASTLALVIFFFVMMVLTGGRTAFISLLLIFSFFILQYVLEEKNVNKHWSFGIACLMLLTLFGANSLESLDFEGDYWERTILWRSAIDANPSPLLGVGTGDTKQVLNEYYRLHAMEVFAEGSYNSHNQFIHAYFTNGILGLLSILLLLGWPLYIGTRNQNALLILVIFPFVIYGMTEVFLGRYQGVVFFAFLQAIFMNHAWSLTRGPATSKVQPLI